ncbi:MAG: ribosome biogenesis GTPase Der [Pseudomonadota bacterium]
MSDAADQTYRPLVAIIGRPNVGKSTLFNRLVGKRLALVDDTPGVTRDRREGDATLGDLAFTLIDTAGLEEGDAGSLTGRMRAQTERAMDEADVCLFVMDARAGLTPTDKEFATLMHRFGGKTILVANKVEGKIGLEGAYEAFELGLGEPVAISAEHGEGMGELFSALDEKFSVVMGHVASPKPEQTHDETSEFFSADDEEEDGPTIIEAAPRTHPLRVAIVGRPNAGKSTLVNCLLGDERLLTGPEAGITRDTIAVDWTFEGRPFKLFDTAGMRRKARVQEKLEKLSVSDALRAIQFAECVIILMDAERPFEKQDLQIADLVAREGRALVFGLNKWDLVRNKETFLKVCAEELERLLPQVRGAPLVPLSGLNGKGTENLIRAVLQMDDVWNRRVSTAALNRWLSVAITQHPPPAVAGRRLKLRYMTQAKSRPPTFAVFCSRPDALPGSYNRYLVNGLRDTFDMRGVPLRINLRKSDNPYASKAKKRKIQ